jgi:L-lactate dehydrogenase
VWDERAVLPVSTRLTGQCGISGVYLSLPCVPSANAVDRVIAPPLDEADARGVRACAEVLRAARAELDGHWAAQAAAG